MMKSTHQTNRLINEKSPYLLQHAHNPVDWFPWGDEAFKLAEQLEKPIFLSIGYSTCHWCHVMEKESFEDAEVAKLLNEKFICIKVDKEERPDIDNIYMAVAQITTGSGGWPLNIILTPHKKPFYVDTYIPKHNRYNKLGLMELIPKLSNLWLNERERIIYSSENILETLKLMHYDTLDLIPDKNTINKAFKDLSNQFDKEKGGFGNAPKFPSPHNLIFLLRYWKSSKDQNALDIVEKTLQAIRYGGIYDHIGNGVHRYSTDSGWLVPHFEKMLYDQALLSLAYTESYEATGKQFYKQASKRILDYILRDLTGPKGGFYAGEDADSEGIEGKFYVWDTNELAQILTPEEFEIFSTIYNIREEGNFRDEVTRKLNGLNIPHLNTSVPNEKEDQINIIRKKLFMHRENRIHPHKDDKILTDWNGLTIAALAKASRVFNDPKYLKAALKALNFISESLLTKDFELLHDYRNNQTSTLSFIDDYAFMIYGLIELYQSTFNADHLTLALKLNEVLLSQFWDKESGGFFFTSNKNETLLLRKKEIYDGAIPSGNSIAMLNLLRLSLLTNNMSYRDYALKIAQVFSKAAKRMPTAYTMLLTGLLYSFDQSCKIVISSQSDDRKLKELLNKLNSLYIPDKIIILNNVDNTDYPAIENKPTMYICTNNKCFEPITDIDKVKSILF